MPSKTGYRAVDDSSQHSENTIEEHAEGIQLENSHFSKQAAAAQAIPSNLQLFNSNQQTRKLFLSQSIRWIGTLIFVAFMLATLKVYHDKDNFSHDQKYAFNTIVTACSLGLGLNFFEAFKDIAKVLRWRILANKRHSVREIDLIISIENLTTVFELAWECRKQILILLACFSWIAQAAVAVIGLSYSVDSGTDYRGVYTQPGTVNASDLSCYYNNNACPVEPEVPQIVAHTYGDISQSDRCCQYKELSDVLNSDKNCAYYCNRTPGQEEFAYRFTETNPEDFSRTYPLFTNRVVTASYDQCYQYDVNQTSGKKVDDDNGDRAAYNWSYSNGTISGNITIPTEYSAIDSTTYIYRGLEVPQNETENACGPQYQPQTVFQCPITISSVSNTTLESQTISNGMAKLAAASIGLQGRSVNQANGRIWTQYQLYPYGSRWEIHNLPINIVGSRMAEFALGSLASMAIRNPTVQSHGAVPILGFHLTVQWEFTLALCASILIVHFLLFAAAVYTSRLVIIKDDSNLSTARLLRPLVDHLGGQGTLIGGKDLSKAMEDNGVKGLVYGPREDPGAGGRILDISDRVMPRRTLARWRHPDGIYL
ncbi:hypothetical protein JMJ35_008093 [Cladonia borealis]|uniref:Uncharacterized protein n=1 Tax=Cladonia borealis TaxID=184061 RepID=A0AA39V3B5_9LECA|nr:hypothetical protein JMJ35_008093 [Cladonia borealis]